MPIAMFLASEFAEFTHEAASPETLLTVGFIAVVLAIAFGMSAAQNRRPERGGDRSRLCRSCALSHPPFANYCRRCGRRL